MYTQQVRLVGLRVAAAAASESRRPSRTLLVGLRMHNGSATIAAQAALADAARDRDDAPRSMADRLVFRLAN